MVTGFEIDQQNIEKALAYNIRILAESMEKINKTLEQTNCLLSLCLSQNIDTILKNMTRHDDSNLKNEDLKYKEE